MSTSPSLEPAPSPNSRRRFPLALAGTAILFVLFVAGLLELFQLRFETGDVYPPYSTLRSDPLGAAAFYEALAEQKGLRVERNLRSLERLDQGPLTFFRSPGVTPPATTPATIFYLGANPYEWPFLLEKASVDRLEELLRGGARLVVTFQPGNVLLTTERLEHNREDAAGSPLPSPSPGSSPGPAPRPTPSARERRLREERSRADLLSRWGLDFGRVESKREEPKSTPGERRARFSLPTPPPAPTPMPTPLPIAKTQVARPVPGGEFAQAGQAPWHTALDFQVEAPAARAAGWRVLYERDGRPVVVARPFGGRGGEIVLVGDSYFLSNEALRTDPRPALLAALVGARERVVFDESHQGIREQPGLMTLARRYGLQGALAATGVLVGLFIWRNVLSLVPPAPTSREDGTTDAAVPGRESAAGFHNLLRRGVPTRELLAACLTRWRVGGGRRPGEAATVARLQAFVDAEAARPIRERNVPAAYRAMCAAVRPGK